MKSIGIAVTVLFVSSCSAAPSKDAIGQNSTPDWFQSDLKRELAISSTKLLEIPELNVSDQVLGNFELIDQDEGYWYFVSEVEGTTPVECYVYTEFDGAANTLSYVIDYELEYIGETFEQEISERSNFGHDIGVIGSVPYIEFDTLYYVDVDNEKAAGVVKAISAQTNNSLQVCIHNEIGFKDTFNSIAQSFITAIANSEDSESFYEVIYQTLINGSAVGFVRESYFTDEEGDVFMQRDQSFAVPVDNASFSRTDTSYIEWSDSNGSLINADSFTVENGEVKSNLKLTATENSWIVEGQLQAKEVQQDLNHDGWILSSYGTFLAVDGLVKSENTSREYPMWIENADPGVVTEVIFNEITDNPEANIELVMGPVSTEAYYENSIVQRASSRQGNLSVDLEIMHVSGAPILE